jgi:tetratricopeptide (TPR) repeat protein
MPLYRSALGPFTRPIIASSPDAQAYFDQGAQLMYAFAQREAVRSFGESERRDSTCAMCFWGEAWARGAYLNGPMQSEGGAAAYRAARRAQALAATRATPADRALIAAMAVRYEPRYDPATRKRLDSAYAAAMARAHADFPQDDDVATLYAESLMLLEPRRGNWDPAKPSVATIHRVLEGVLARHREHPGACHLYVHATESTPQPEKAESCAELLGSSIPGASHINHMPSHTFNRIGRWGDAVRANIMAWHSDLRSAGGGGFAIYPSHNLHMLLFAASMDGQGAVAEQAARDYARLETDGAFYRALVLMRFGRFDEVLQLGGAPRLGIPRGLWDFARGYAFLRTGAADSAHAQLARVEQAAKTIPDSLSFRGHPASRLLGLAAGILRGELLRREGRSADGIAALERAVVLEDALRYDEPEPLPFLAHDWLGAAYLDAGRAVDAERVYRAALVKRPRNGWSLVGLERSLRAQGRSADANEVHRQLVTTWARADTWITASRF